MAADPGRRRRGALGAFFIFAGTMHFVKTPWYVAIMPPYVPRHREMVLASGAAEIAGGVAALHPRTSRFARWWLIATLLAIFPANVHMAVNPDQVKGLKTPRPLLWIRLPFQALFIWWVLRATRD